jgi:hypothetical protein
MSNDPPRYSTRWSDTHREFRTTIRWYAGALSATAAALFSSASLVSFNDSSPSRWPLIDIWKLGGLIVLCIIGLAIVLFGLLSLLLPETTTPVDAPKWLKDKIDKNPQGYLPGDSSSLEDFITRRYAYARSVVELQAMQPASPEVQRALTTQLANLALFLDREQELTDRISYERARRRLTFFPIFATSGLIICIFAGLFAVRAWSDADPNHCSLTSPPRGSHAEPCLTYRLQK